MRKKRVGKERGLFKWKRVSWWLLVVVDRVTQVDAIAKARNVDIVIGIVFMDYNPYVILCW